MKRIAILASLIIMSCNAAVPVNELQKVYYHRTNVSAHHEQAPILELATVVLYFSHDASVKKTELKRDNKKIVMRYVFPNAIIASVEVKTMLQEFKRNLESSAQGLYNVELHEMENPKRIEMIISYDPHLVNVEYDFFDSIKFQKGIAFHFYNKKFINSMNGKFNGNAILQTASVSKKPRIIIDPGHGGKDSGTVGFFGVPEKDITLAVADKVVKTLKQKGFSAMLTRDKDQFVALDERTVLANNCKQPCIFISLHGNHAANKQVSGIETYCLKKDLFTRDDASVRTCIDIIDTYKESLCTQGQRLAQMVHSNILKEVRKIDTSVNDRMVKHAVSQVLMGVTMPSILIEMDFLSNESKAKLLASAEYQQAIADGIMQGVLQYLG